MGHKYQNPNEALKVNNRDNNQGSSLIWDFLSGIFDLLFGEYFLLLIPLVVILILVYMFVKSMDYVALKLTRHH